MPYQLKRPVVDDISKHGIAALFMAMTHQDHRIQRIHRFSSAGLTKTKQERLLDATVGLVAIIANMTKLPVFNEVQRLRKNKRNLLARSHYLGIAKQDPLTKPNSKMQLIFGKLPRELQLAASLIRTSPMQ